MLLNDRDGVLRAEPGAPTVASASALRSLCEVTGVATRSFAPADEVLVYFGYSLTPFYSKLPEERVAAAAAEAEAAAAAEAAGGSGSAAASSSVRWLRHRLARPFNDFELASDASRRNLLYELYDEAQEEEVRQKAASKPPLLAWLGGASGGVSGGASAAATTRKRDPSRPSVLKPLRDDFELEARGEAEGGGGEGEGEGAAEEDETDDELDALGTILGADVERRDTWSAARRRMD